MSRLSAAALLFAASAGVAAPALDRPPLSRLGRAPFGHGHEAHGLAFTPDGKQLVTTGYDHRARLWDVATGDELRAFGNPEVRPNPFSEARWVYAAAVSPDGKTLATGLYATGWPIGSVTLWDLEKGTEIRTLDAGQAGVTALAFSADGATLLAGTGDRGSEVIRWEVATGREVQRVGLGGGAVRAVGLLAGGRQGVALAGTAVKYWDLGTGKLGPPQAGLPEEAEALAGSPDGTTLAVAEKGGAVRLWDPAAGKELRRLAGHKATVRGLAFSADGKHLASADESGSVRAWEAGTGKPLGWAEAPPADAPRAVGVSLGGKLMACAIPWEGRARVWEVATGKVVAPETGHAGGVRAAAVSAAGAISTAAQDGTLRRWDVSPPLVVRTPAGGSAFAFSADGAAAAWGGADGRVHVLDWRTGKEARAIAAHPDAVTGLAFSPDGKKLATAGGEKGIRLWDPATGKEAGKLDAGASANHLRFSADGSLLVWKESAGVGTAKPEDGAAVQVLVPPEGHALTQVAAVSPDAQWVVAGTQAGTVLVWGPDRAKEPRQLTGPRGYVMAAAFSPDGRTLAGGGWGTAHLWEVATWQPQTRLDAGSGDTLALAFAPNGRSLVAGGLNGWVGVYDLPGVARAGKPKPRTLAAAERDELWAALGAEDAAAAYKALWALAEFPDAALPLLREALKPAKKGDGSADTAVLGRLMALLEQLRSPAARTLLEELAGGDPDGPQTRQAKAALVRLGPK